MDSIFQKTADRLYPDSPETYRLKKTFFNVLAYIDENDWQGACHATTAILFVLLREQGIAATPYVGEVSKAPIVFDHSWIEVDSEVCDAAVMNSLVRGVHFHLFSWAPICALAKKPNCCTAPISVGVSILRQR
jgi:hypothetical protein